MIWTTVLLLGLAVAAGAFVQSSIGFGMAVVAAPFVVVVEPRLLPVALLVVSFALPVVQLVQGPRDIDKRALGWALLARVVTTGLGVWAVSVLSVDGISVLVAVLILVTVGLSATPLRIKNTPASAAAAGAISGVAGTAASIGGPFLALVLAGEKPERVRATLSAFFLAGTIVSMGALLAAGQVRTEALLTGLVWIPFMAAGYACAVPLRRRLDRDRLRRLVLIFCTVAALALIVRIVLL